MQLQNKKNRKNLYNKPICLKLIFNSLYFFIIAYFQRPMSFRFFIQKRINFGLEEANIFAVISLLLLFS